MSRRSGVAGSFVAHSLAMRESWAWRGLPDNARRVLDRLELEHMRHGGASNGKLVCTYDDFAAAGIRRKSVALAIRQCVALGFLEITAGGYRSRAEFRAPSLYRLTYVFGRGKGQEPTNEWQKIESEAHAGARLNACSLP